MRCILMPPGAREVELQRARRQAFSHGGLAGFDFSLGSLPSEMPVVLVSGIELQRFFQKFAFAGQGASLKAEDSER